MKRLSILRIITMIAGLSFIHTSSAVVLFSEDFSDNGAGWILDTNWEIGATSVSPSATGNQDPEFDHTTTSDNGVLGALLGDNIGSPEGLHDFYYATSPVLNLSAATNVNLSFYRWLNSDYDPYMTSQVEVFDGASWEVIYTNCCVGAAGYVTDSSWSLQSYDVSAYADGNSQFQVRFSYDVTNTGVFTISGWNVDDLQVTGDASVPAPATLALMGLGLAGVGFQRRRKAA